MALINDVPALQILTANVNKTFTEVYNRTDTSWEKVAMKIPSGALQEVYPFVPGLEGGTLREWLGPRVVQNLKVLNRVVTNKVYEKTDAMPRLVFETDKYDIWAQQMIPKLARSAKVHPDRLLANRIVQNEVTYDGRPFFDGYHGLVPDAPNSASAGPADANVDTGNALTSTQTNSMVSMPLNPDNFAKARAIMLQYKDPGRIPLGIMPDTLMVPPSLEYAARVLLNTTFSPIVQNGSSGAGDASGPASNVWQGAANLVVNRFLPDSGDPLTATWYLLDTSTIRPFIVQELSAMEFTPQFDPALPPVFDNDEFRVGVRWAGNCALSIYFHAARITGASDFDAEDDVAEGIDESVST